MSIVVLDTEPEAASTAARTWTQHVRTPARVEAELSYVRATEDRVINYMFDPPAGVTKEGCEYDNIPTTISDARELTHPTSVEVEGFALWHAPSEVADFYDDDAVRRRYYPEVIRLALAATGAARGIVFDHLRRKREAGRTALTFGRAGDGSRPAAVGRIHNDYSEWSGQRRLALVLKDAREQARVGRFGVVNVWRSIAHPVVDTPLAVCDARTVSARDLVTSEIRYPDRTGEIYLVSHAPAQRWWYYEAMHRDEALVFKQYDSQASGVARFVPHAAFDHPSMPPDAPLRESIEARCLVIYD